MWSKWLPWRWLVSRLARAHGFLDPAELLTRLHQFAQPSEVAEPIELLRAGVTFHARGLINTRAIQYNLDWDWPFWVRRQFDPHDAAFIPRGFSITHINLTHRNWTAVGLPGLSAYPIIDPRGLLTPHFDGWSIDAALLARDGRHALSSDGGRVEQTLVISDDRLAVRTLHEFARGRIVRVAEVAPGDPNSAAGPVPVCRLDLHFEIAASTEGAPEAIPAVLLRPANPEGASFIRGISIAESGRQWTLDDGRQSMPLALDPPPDDVRLSTYREGDVLQRWRGLPSQSEAAETRTEIACRVGLATGLAAWRLPQPDAATGPRTLRVRVETPLIADHDRATRPLRARLARWLRRGPGPQSAGKVGSAAATAAEGWRDAMARSAGTRCALPDPGWSELFRIAERTLVLLAPDEIYPGPYTYRRFWFRDAALMTDALLALGHLDRVRCILDNFFERQTAAGYFKSQEGEWDSNGEALWILNRYRLVAGVTLPEDWMRGIERGAEWIIQKRLPDADDAQADVFHTGLMPAGFSAEHLGPNDYYYWDAFWSVAGLRAAAEILRSTGKEGQARRYAGEADSAMQAIERSLSRLPSVQQGLGVPASPYRRMDAGAVGSIVAGYPLHLWAADDPRLRQSLRFLTRSCLVGGGFFQDMIHSGINAYLTLHLAQNLLRAGDPGWHSLVQAVARLASPTGQWPEAIHPQTLGGCMGDGQHGWAASEWVIMMKNLVVAEEGDDRIVLAAGAEELLRDPGERMDLGPVLTRFGSISVQAERRSDGSIDLSWDANWRDDDRPQLLVRSEGHLTPVDTGRQHTRVRPAPPSPSDPPASLSRTTPLSL